MFLTALSVSELLARPLCYQILYNTGPTGMLMLSKSSYRRLIQLRIDYSRIRICLLVLTAIISVVGGAIELVSTMQSLSSATYNPINAGHRGNYWMRICLEEARNSQPHWQLM